MPRYFFDVSDAGRESPDAFGIDLLDDAEARDQALGLLPHLARDASLNADDHEIVVSARNARGEVVYEARLSVQGQWRTRQDR